MIWSFHRFWIGLALTALMALGLFLRARDLGTDPPTGDESESAINALTILEHGLPVDHYLGMPIFENTLTEFSPDDPEYEFRDSSYSSRGVSIYHGWLPLYSMAASFKAFGVHADQPTRELAVQHTQEQMRWRTQVARYPSVLFGGLFMLFLFLAAREMAGLEAAWGALAVGAIGAPFIAIAREARYHSATLAMSTGCCWIIWRCAKRGSWLDYILAAILFTLLFHTHLISFVVAGCAMAIVLPWIVKQPRAIAKLTTFTAILLVGTVPWLLWTGFLTQTSHIPPARAFLSYPGDLLYYPLKKIPDAIVPILCVLWLGLVLLLRDRLPPRLARPLTERGDPMGFLLLWVLLGFLAFTFLIPAASYFYKRLTLAILGPGVLFCAIFFAGIARSWRERPAPVLATLLFIGSVFLTGQIRLWWAEKKEPNYTYEAIDHLRSLKLAPDTKLYCTPNDHFALTFLTGLPVQSIAPVRKRFLDEYPGPILLIDAAVPFKELDWEEIAAVAAGEGQALTAAEAQQLRPLLSTRALRERIAPRVASIDPPLETPVPFVDAITKFQRQKTLEFQSRWIQWGVNNPVLRGYDMPDFSYWWPTFFYRFVDPPSRMGPNANYANRVKSARAEVLATSWIFYHCPPRPSVSDARPK